jgi:hypothetical protein
MGCIATIILVLLSRIAIVYMWLSDRQIFTQAFGGWVLPGSFVIPTWVWPVVGFIFLPWTTLAYLLLYPGGIEGIEWLVLGVALLIDLVGHGGSYRHRNRIPIRRRSEAI